MSKFLVNLIHISLCISFISSAYGNIESENKNIEGLRYNLVSGMPDIIICSMSEKIGHTWSNGNVWEKTLIQSFYSLLATRNDSFIVFDLGAQTGCFSLLAKYLPNSSWYSFEPIQEAVNALKENLLINEIDNVRVIEMAASNFSGKTILRMPTMDAWGLSTLGANVLRFKTAIEREIDCINLDSFVKENNIAKVDFMKLDTEGSELFILLGAQELIMRDQPIILMEYNEINMAQCGVLKSQIDEFLTQMGYEWKLISSEDILCIPTNRK